MEPVPVLVAIGVTELGHKLVLSLKCGYEESALTWREFFKDLKARGLNCQGIIPGIMDGLTGLETVSGEEFPRAKIQGCQVHAARNVYVPSGTLICSDGLYYKEVRGGNLSGLRLRGDLRYTALIKYFKVKVQVYFFDQSFS